MVDPGLTLEPPRAEVVSRMASAAKEQWSGSDLAVLKDGMAPNTSGLPKKLVYGSDYPYREEPGFPGPICEGTDASSSLAFGGFSNVWGGGILPFTARDIQDWPITLADLEPHYCSVLKFMPMAAVCDGLAEILPLYVDEPRPLRPSLQAQALISDLSRNHERLQRAGIRFGYSRLAVATTGGLRPCDPCGLCMYGCPYGLIYSSSSTVRRMQEVGNFRYLPGVIVQRLEERGDQVHVHALEYKTDRPLTFTVRRVYVAAGALATTRILMESLGVYERAIQMRDSQYFLIPMAHFRGGSAATRERSQTLAQCDLTIDDPAISPYLVFLTVYTFSEFYPPAIAGALGPLRAIPGLINQLAGRLLIFGGYFHSEQSAVMDVYLEPASNGMPSQLKVTAAGSSNVRALLRRLLTKLARHAADLHAFPILPMVKMALPGRGHHFGGSFPMRKSPQEFESDTLGRPHGFRAVHIVDAANFPTIAATTITLTVMANAHRIAVISAEL